MGFQKIGAGPGVSLRWALGCGLVLVGCSRPALSCTTPGVCGKGEECLANRCVPFGGEPVDPRTERRVAQPVAMAWVSSRGNRAGARLPGALVFGSRAEGAATLLLRFEPVWAGEEQRIDSAFLLLEPVSETPPSSAPIPLEIWRVEEAWNEAPPIWINQPRLGHPRTRAIASTSPPEPLRIDVTAQLKELARRPDYGLAVRSGGRAAHGATYASGLTGGLGPRLEVYLK